MKWQKKGMRRDLLFLLLVTTQSGVFLRIVRSHRGFAQFEIFSRAYCHIIGTSSPRTRLIPIIEMLEQQEGEFWMLETARHTHKTIEAELVNIVKEMFDLIDNDILPFQYTSDLQVRFLKLKGDVSCYLAETSEQSISSQYLHQTLLAYTAGSQIAHANLPPYDPCCLRLALSFSTFYHKNLDKEKGFKIAKEAFDCGICEVEDLQLETITEINTLMQHLKDNLTLWSSDENDKD
ncbi:putative Checkpoint signal transducer rad25 [Blattamonas nauphoetae]|uniref:Checkpoint signal transducer rad25 n=1 Tax=Blattamonas nauphoetae TaxID=2049346 RepID=A0ABQ9YJ46_9EUKA|nr:putative Checkpoint signal transducer rad25 [Blattamonas nauphoetae]